MAPTFLLKAVFGILVSAFAVFGEEDKIIACFFTNWSQYRKGLGTFAVDDVDPSLCTHLFYAFCKINTTQNTIQPIEWNYASVLHPGILKLKKQKPGLKLILSVGGETATEEGWIHVSDPKNRDEFARNVVTFLRQNQFDGFDVDWEIPNAVTSDDYINLMEALRSAIDAENLVAGRERLILTTDVVVHKLKAKFYTPQKLARVADYVLLMAYNYYGSWSHKIGHQSPLFLSRAEPAGSFYSQHQAVEFWREAGIPLNKMILGLASYGRSMLMDGANLHTPGDSYSGRVPKGAPYTKAPGMYAYYEACVLEKQPGWTKVFMDESRVPYMYGKVNDELVWIGYDDQKSFMEKALYAVSRGMAGLMVWTLDFDDFLGTVCEQAYAYPLLRAINKVVTETKMPNCSTDGQVCEVRGIRGMCVAGFCGCPQGFVLSTKQYCAERLQASDHGQTSDHGPPDASTSQGSQIHAQRAFTYSAWIIALWYLPGHVLKIE